MRVLAAAELELSLELRQKGLVHLDQQVDVDEDSVEVGVREDLTLAGGLVGHSAQRREVDPAQGREGLDVHALRGDHLLEDLQPTRRALGRLFGRHISGRARSDVGMHGCCGGCVLVAAHTLLLVVGIGLGVSVDVEPLKVVRLVHEVVVVVLLLLALALGLQLQARLKDARIAGGGGWRARLGGHNPRRALAALVEVVRLPRRLVLKLQPAAREAHEQRLREHRATELQRQLPRGLARGKVGVIGRGRRLVREKDPLVGRHRARLQH